VVSLVATVLQQQSIAEKSSHLAQTQSAVSEQISHIAETQNAVIKPVIIIDGIQTDADSPAFLTTAKGYYLGCTYGLRLANRGGAMGNIPTFGASAAVLDKVLTINGNDPVNNQNALTFGNTSLDGRIYTIASDGSGVPHFSADTPFHPESLTEIVFPLPL